MNRVHKTLWSESAQCWQAVPETAKAAGKRSVKSASGGVLATVVMGLALSGGAGAQSPPPPASTQLPMGGAVVRGSATISQTATAQAAAMTVNQSSQRAIINWDSFNLGSAASINFVQPNAQAVTLNRVNDNNPSQIFGRITSNGQVFLSNPSGVYFSPTASVDVGALVATTHSISDAHFMAGNYQFERNGATGKVVNEGRISAALGGYVALLAPEVQNAGVVLARAGTVALAAGEVISLQVQGGGLAGITTTPSAIATLIENKLAVQAPDGQIILSAVALNKLQAGVIKNSGSLEANSLVAKGGKIYLEADDITLAATSRIEAKGPTGGGTVLVGGDWQGSGDMRQATKVTMEAGASIDASATDQGDGGKVVLWSDIHNADSVTRVAGTVLAEGKGEQTKGGQIETSGASLQIAESANVQMGGRGSAGGLWLLDPTDFSIAPTGGDITGANLSASISAGNTVEVLSNGASGTAGAIKITDAISWNNTGALKLSPTNYVQGFAAGTIAMLGGGELIVNQPSAGTLSGVISGNGKVSTIGVGALTLSGANTYSGGTTVGAGASLILNRAPVMSGTTITSSSAGTGSLTLNSGSTLKLGTSTTAINLPNNIFINGAATIQNATTSATAPNISGVIADGSTPGQSLTLLIDYINSSMELSGSNTYTGITTMGSSRNYFISHSSALGASNAGTVLALGSYLNLKGGITVDDNIEAQGSYIKNASGANTIRSVLTTTNTSTIWSAADSLTFAPTGGTSAQAINTTTKNMAIWGPGNVYVAGKISGSGTITLSTSAMVSFSGINNYSGATTITSGTLRVESDSGLGVTPGGPVTIGGTSTLELAGPATGGLTIGNKTLTVSNTGSIRNVSGSNSYAGAMTLVGDATISVDTGSSLNFTATGSPISIAAGKRLTLNLTDGDLTIAKDLTGASAASSYVRTGSGVLSTGANSNLARGIYVRLSDRTGSDFSSSYGDTPDYTFGFFNSSTGSTKVNLAATDYSLGSLVWTTTGSGTTAPTATSNAGTYAMTYASGLTVSNASYVLLGAGAATNWTVAKAPLTVTANSASKTYGDPNPTFSATLSGFKNGQSLLTSGVTGSGSATTTATTATGAGTATITAGVGSLTASNYDFSNLVNGTLTINKAPLTVTANNASKTYGDANPTLSATVSGFVNGESLATSGVAGSGSATTTATTTTASGTAVISAGVGTLTASNYDFSNLVNGTLTINKAPLTVTANNASKTYGGANPTLSTTVSGFVNGETLGTSGVAGTGSATTTATTTTGAGTATITAGVGSLTASNYDFSNLVNGTLTINKASLTVTANNASKTYGDANPTLSATVSGFVNGESLTTSGVAGSGSATTTATTTTVSGTAVISAGVGTLTASNYDFSNLVNGMLTINKAPLTVTANNASKTYGGANPTLSTTVSGFVNGETLATSGVAGTGAATTTATTATGAGTATITAGVGSLTASNYDFSNLVNGTLTINKAPLTVTANNASKTYGDANPTLSTTVSGFVNGETLATSGVAGTGAATTTATTATGAGTATITAGVGTLTANNYDFSNLVNGTLTINKAPLTVTANNASKTYGDANPALGTTVSGFVNGETLATSGVAGTGAATTTATTATGAGTATITAGVGTLTANNYDFSNLVNGTLTINKANLTRVTASKTYDGLATVAFGQMGTIAGVNGETFTATMGTASISDKNVATTGKTLANLSGLTLTSSNGGLTSNYNLGSGLPSAGSNNTVTITAANLPVSGLTASNKVYDGTATATLGGAAAISPIAGDTVTLSGSATGSFADANEGSAKPITTAGLGLSGADASNYSLVQQTGLSADITKAPAKSASVNPGQVLASLSLPQVNPPVVPQTVPAPVLNVPEPSGPPPVISVAPTPPVVAATPTPPPTVVVTAPTPLPPGNTDVTPTPPVVAATPTPPPTVVVTAPVPLPPGNTDVAPTPPVVAATPTPPPTVVVTAPAPLPPGSTNLSPPPPVVVATPTPPPTVNGMPAPADTVAPVVATLPQGNANADTDNPNSRDRPTANAGPRPVPTPSLQGEQVAYLRPAEATVPAVPAMPTVRAEPGVPPTGTPLVAPALAQAPVLASTAVPPPAPAPAPATTSPPATASVQVASASPEAPRPAPTVASVNAPAAAPAGTGVLAITILRSNNAQPSTAGVAFEQNADTVSLRATDAPSLPPSSERLVFNDRLTTFMVANSSGTMVEFQGSLVNNRMVIVAPSNAAKLVAQTDMNTVLAAAVTSLGRESRVMLAQLEGVVLDLR